MKREERGYDLRLDDADVTVLIVADCVEWVRAAGECAGGIELRESALHQELLRAIAERRCSDPAACAAEVLRTLKIYAPGWSTMPMFGVASEGEA